MRTDWHEQKEELKQDLYNAIQRFNKMLDKDTDGYDDIGNIQHSGHAEMQAQLRKMLIQLD